MPGKRIHLVCNAHLDPVWLWPWEDGLTEALSTFRTAADFCDRYPGFVFNHNEVLLYRWVEEYEPQLFRRIRKLVADGRWEIAGGAYLQPDVNNSSGESHVRQFLLGRGYFEAKFGRYPRTAYNFDPFGHGEGFPQILSGCGMERYVFCRPDYGTYDLPVGPFTWRDRSGSAVVARRSDDHYLTNGRFVERARDHLPHFDSEPVSMILWGIGNHGGGPSREEYRSIREYARAHPEYELIDSTPDRFFDEVLERMGELPEVRGEIQSCFPGCYTSMSRVKRTHREAESLMASTERLAALAWWWDAAPYPARELEIAWRDILFAEFHDVLPGSGVPSVERDSLQLLSHAREILRRQRLGSFHSLICRDPGGAPGEVPVFVANPHGFRVRRQVEFELQLDDNAWAISHPEVRLRCDDRNVTCQRLQAEAGCAGDWRVRLVALVDLAPWEVLRFDEYHVNDRGRKQRLPRVSARSLSFKTRSFHLRIDPRTGLIDHLALPGSRRSLVGRRAFQPACWADLDHSWTCGSPQQAGSHRIGSVAPPWDRAPAARFRLATPDEAARLSPPPADKWTPGSRTAARPLNIVEHGRLRTVVEAVFVCGPSAVVRQYVIGHTDGSLEIRDRVFNNHRDAMLKLMVPLAFDVRDGISEALYSAVERPPTGRHEERTNQRWVAVRGTQAGRAVHLAVLNTGSFGHSLTGRELALNVLRAPAYSSFNLDPGDERANRRFAPRQDQGEHDGLCYQVLVGRRFDEARVSRAAQVLNAPPVWQVYYPQPEGVDRRRRQAVVGTVSVDDARVQVVALKRSEQGEQLIVRLQNTSAREREVTVRVRPHRQGMKVRIGRFGLATLAVDKGEKKLRWRRVDLVERPLGVRGA